MGFIITPLAKRLTVLNDAAKQFASGNVKARIKPSRFTYIKDVDVVFSWMNEICASYLVMSRALKCAVTLVPR